MTATSSSLPPPVAAPLRDPLRDVVEIGAIASDCLARAVARGVYAATALPFARALPAWRDKFGG
jgi:L-aminopeptidase/D-esterase-like protein